MVSFHKKYKRKNILKRDKLRVIERNGLFCLTCKAIIHLEIDKHKRPYLKNGHFHHIIPMVYGGLNVPKNICILCVSCHLEIHSGSEDKEKYVKMYENFIRFGILTGDKTSKI